MQENVEEVIAWRPVAPQLVFQPESSVQKGIILLRRTRFKPDPPEAEARTQFGARDVVAIVPDEPALQRGQIREQRRRKHRECDPRVAAILAGGRSERTRRAGSSG